MDRLPLAVLALIGLALPGLASTASAPAAATVAAQGLAVELPAGWHGRAYESASGLLVAQAASFPLPDARNDDLATTSQRHIARDGILMVVLRWPEPPPAGQRYERPAAILPLQIRPRDFASFACGIVAPATAMRSALVEGRLLQVFVFFGSDTPGDEEVERANAVLAGILIT